MRLKNGEKTRLFYKYFFSYAVIFFIPFITISFFVYNEATKIIKEEVIASNISKLEQVKDISDTRIKDMKSIATNIATDDKMSAFMLMQPYESKLAIQQLIKYNANNSSIDGLFLYIDGHPYIYTSSGTITLDTYAQKSFNLSKSETENLRQGVQESNVPVFDRHQLSSTDEHIVSYIYPISQGNERKVVFLMKEKSYHNLVQHVLGDFNGANYIFDHHENMITASKKNNAPVSASEIRQLATKEQEVIHKKMAGEDYSIAYIRSDLTGWTFITAMPTNQFFGKLEDLQQAIIYILIAIAMIGIIIITIVSSRQYKPLQNLVSLLRAKHIIDSNHLANHAKDELTSLHESILYISDKSEKLYLKMEHQAPYVREQLLLQLVSGNIENTNEIVAILADVGVDFKHKHVFVLLISKLGENVPFSDQSSLYTRLDKIEFKNSIGYGIDLPDDNSYGMIVSLDNEEVQHQYVDGIIQTVKGMILQSDFSIGVGQTYNELEKINRSFVEAKAAMEYAMITNQGICIYFDQITQQNNTTTWFPVSLQVKLSQSLKQGDYIVANETISEILNYTISIQAPIYMTKAMTYDLTNTMLKVIAEQHLLYDVTDIKRIFKFQSIDELYHMLDRIAIYICKEINQKKRNNQNLLNRQLLDYLQKEFTNPDLSLEKVAGYLNLSVPYTSRFIKEHTGYTFTQIIWDMRMKECQRLLLNTSIPIKEIVKQVGYYDVANFTRRFKKEIGLTPSQFRKKQMNTAL
ncbi:MULTISPECIES: helix-turn-helix domain-containing protein [Clostridia]|uniref:helix-turn-helix domain-containing protein n=1 Tax=Clostridia TaxID=186801 RepID=UPI000EA3AAB9|nr:MULTISPECIES: helix-turn-helix domain-containing protein [Clostridia]NBJ68854.1 AraC family transcriptional regulator [Roseburia sp. 1XD42-34]RKI80231.1 AraC family transcriptional regulator [Clostridium sp. 1xD42-85]